MNKHMEKWAQSHRPERHPASAEHTDTMVVLYGPHRTHSTMGHMHSMATGDKPRPWSARDREGGLLARLHWNHEKRAEGAGVELPKGSPDADPLGSVRLPHFVEQLYHLIVDDEHDGHVQADPAQAGDSALVKPG